MGTHQSPIDGTDGPARPALWPRACLVSALICLLSPPLLLIGWWRYHEWATPRDLDRRAPLVADVQASYCELSPGGRYLAIEGPEIRPGSAFIDTATGTIVTVSFPPNIQWLRDSGRYERELFRDKNKPEVWLREGVFFVYFRYTAGNDRGRTYDVPWHCRGTAG